jgi:hypothetical protein
MDQTIVKDNFNVLKEKTELRQKPPAYTLKKAQIVIKKIIETMSLHLEEDLDLM